MDREVRHDRRHAHAIVDELLHQLTGDAGAEVEEGGGQRGSIEQERAPAVLDAAPERSDGIARMGGVGLEVGGVFPAVQKRPSSTSRMKRRIPSM